MITMVEDTITKYEDSGFVVSAVRYADGRECRIEMSDDYKGVCAVCLIPVEDYEENGFTTDGLSGTWQAI